MNEHGEPFTKEELLQSFEQNKRDVAEFFSSIQMEKFYAHPADVWSARDNIDHLNKSIAPVAKALGLPKVLPLVLFGKAKQPSKSFEKIRETYQGKLKEGAKATGRYIPDKVEIPKDADEEKQELLKTWNEVSDKLIAVLKNKWSEKDLDTYTLPHPILGKLTVREMLFFTLYHNTHHVNNVGKLLESLQT